METEIQKAIKEYKRKWALKGARAHWKGKTKAEKSKMTRKARKAAMKAIKARSRAKKLSTATI